MHKKDMESPMKFISRLEECTLPEKEKNAPLSSRYSHSKDTSRTG